MKTLNIDINNVILETDITIYHSLFVLQHQCLADRWRVISNVRLDLNKVKTAVQFVSAKIRAR